MNHYQRAALAVGALVISAMALFPPWLFVYDFPGNRLSPAYHSQRSGGYHPIWQSHNPTDQAALASIFSIPTIDYRSMPQHFSMRLDKDRLWIQIGATLAVIGLLTLLLKSKQKPTH